MANHASAERRNRQRIKRTARNQSIKRSVRTAVKKARQALVSGQDDKAAQLVRHAESLLDRAANKGVVARKASARTKSRLYSKLTKLSETTAK